MMHVHSSPQNLRKTGWVFAVSIIALWLTAPALGQSDERNPPAFSAGLNNGEIRLGVQNFGTEGGCSLWSPEGHANWNIFQTCQKYNPTELARQIAPAILERPPAELVSQSFVSLTRPLAQARSRNAENIYPIV
jgi:hypothetical protein